MSFDVNQQYPDIPRKRFPWGCLLGGCCVVMLLMAGGIGHDADDTSTDDNNRRFDIGHDKSLVSLLG